MNNPSSIHTQINKTSSLLKQELEEIITITKISQNSINKLPPPTRTVVIKKLQRIDAMGSLLKKLETKLIKLSDDPIFTSKSENFRYYVDKFKPISDDIETIAYKEIRDAVDKLFSDTEINNISNSESVKNRKELKNTFDFAFERVDDYIDRNKDIDDLLSLEDQYKRSMSILRSIYFDPDGWDLRISELSPINTIKTINQIPIQTKIRIKEIYHSYIFGNWMAVLSLSRSLLEYSILDRKHLFVGEDVYQEDGRTKPMWDLKQILASKFPELKSDTDDIVSYGNDIMHPKKNKKTTILPYRQNDAKKCVEKISRVVSYLYS